MTVTWDLAVVLVPPPGTGPVMRAGAAELVMSALDELELEMDYYTKDDDLAAVTVVLVGVEPAGRSQELLGQVAGGLVESAVQSTPELLDWSHRVEVSVTAPDDEDDGTDLGADLDEELAKLLPDGDMLAEDLVADIAVEQSVYDAARLFRGLPVDDLVVEDQTGLTDREQAACRRRADALAGCLVQGAIVLTDQLFTDIADMRTEGDEFDVDQSWILAGLPPRYAVRYTPLFAQEFLVTVVDLSTRLTGTWASPACIAQELGLRILLDQVEVTSELADVELAEGWREHLEDLLFDDLDHEVLYDPSLDGIEDEPDLQPPGMAPMRFDDWFTPFKDDQTLPPYALRF